MDMFDLAKELYRDGKHLIDQTRDRAVFDDALRWAREDLDEALLDLKRAVIDQEPTELVVRLRECWKLIAHIAVLLDENQEE